MAFHIKLISISKCEIQLQLGVHMVFKCAPIYHSYSKYMLQSLVRSNLAYCSQVWAPQAVNLIVDIERIQRRATKFILSLPYRSEVRQKQRILKIGLLPLCYWHEFLDLVYVFKCLVSLSVPFISVMNFTRPRRTVSSKGTLLNTIRANTVTFENSFYCSAPRI